MINCGIVDDAAIPKSNGHIPDAQTDLWRKNSVLALIIGVMGLILLAQWIYNIVHRLPFPFPIEYIEDAIFHQSLRIYHGLPVYIHWNDGYSPLIYTPGYFYLTAALFKILGPSIVIPRVISLLCTLGIMAMLLKLSISRLRFPLSIIPLCVYLSLPYAYFMGFQDLGRVDSLMILMIFAGLFLINDDRAGPWKIIGGAVLITLACYVKQPALAYLYFVYIYLFIRFKGIGFVAIAISFAVLLGIFFAADGATDGWFAFYTWHLPMTHAFNWSVGWGPIIGGWIHATWFRGMIYLSLAIAAFIIFRIITLRRERVNAFEATLPGALIATIGPFIKEGGHYQDLIPLYTHLCFLLPYALTLPLFRAKQPAPNAPAAGAHYITSAILFLLMLHCVFSITPWDDFRPKSGNVRIGWDYVNEIRQIDGDVLMPSMTYYAWLAGKDQDYIGASLMDLLYVNIKPLPLINDVESGRYSAICLPFNFDADGYWQDSLDEYGYTGPAQIISAPRFDYDLCINIELPPTKVYRKIDQSTRTSNHQRK